MPIDAYIRDPSTQTGLHINTEGTLGNVEHAHPSMDDEINLLPYRADFELNGSAQMAGAVGTLAAPVDYCIAASNEYDTWIKTISTEITDTNPAARLFGSLPRLTNGVSFVWISQDAGERTLATIRSNFELIRYGSTSTPAWGAGTTSFIISNAVANNDDSYLVSVDLNALLGFRWGLRLRKGTNDRIVWRIQDDLTGLVSFTSIVGGTQI
jgi:hypothetical protein